MSTEKKNPGNRHGLSKKEWLALWEAKKWNEEVVATCYKIATCPHADVSDRAIALDIWGALEEMGLAGECPDAGRTYPEVVRDVQFDCLAGTPTRNEDLRLQMEERLEAVKFTVSTVSQFLDIPAVVAQARALAGAKDANALGGN